MKTIMTELAEYNKNKLAAQAEQALLERIPVDQKTLRRAIKLMEPKNLKRMGVLVIGSSALLTLAAVMGRERIFKARMAHEIKKQLTPLRRQLDELEAQNAALWAQNEALKAKVEALQQPAESSEVTEQEES